MNEKKGRRSWKGAGFLIGAASAAVISMPATGAAQIVQAPGGAQANAAAIYSYWTPQRMATATPVSGRASAGGPQSLQIPESVPGDPGSSPGAFPNGNSAAAALAIRSASEVSPAAVGYHSPIPFTRWQYFAKYRVYPVSTVGKLFFTNNGGNYVCSGSTLYTNVVWTAGHCTGNTDGTHQFSTNLLFCPSYDNGVNPAVGCWAGFSQVLYTAWFNNNSFEWDMSSFNTSTCGTVNCTSIANITGFLVVAWNQGYEQHWMPFGYPQGPPFNGNKIQLCSSEFGYQDSEGNNQGGPNSAAVGCDMTGGSSGGPWILQFGKPGQIGGLAGNYLNGHQDWFHTAFPNEINTPYFDCRPIVLLNASGRPIGGC